MLRHAVVTSRPCTVSSEQTNLPIAFISSRICFGERIVESYVIVPRTKKYMTVVPITTSLSW